MGKSAIDWDPSKVKYSKEEKCKITYQQQQQLI